MSHARWLLSKNCKVIAITMQNHKWKDELLHNFDRPNHFKIHLKEIYILGDMQILNAFQIDRAWPFAMMSQAGSPQSWT